MTFLNLQLLFFYGFFLLPTLNADSCSRPNECLPPIQPNDVDSGAYDDLQNNAEHICTRECREGEEPKICYYEFVVEIYSTMGGACESCPLSRQDCFNPQCVPADGEEKMILSINRQLPGPSIQVCQGDKIVVDVVNKMKGRSLTIHWHGIRQVGTQYMDGVPMVTQCPILEGQIFRYIFLADSPGTFFYHSHSGLQKTDGLTGSIIIRRPKNSDPNGYLYDHDLPSHHCFFMDWMHTPADDRWPGLIRSDVGQRADSYLINGYGIFTDPSNVFSTLLTPIKVYNVKPNRRYLFRLTASLCLSCQMEVTFESHSLIAISTDDGDAVPVTFDKIVMSAGERFAVIVFTNQYVQSYWITVQGLDACSDAYQVAILHYEGSDSEMPSTLPFLETGPAYYLNPKNSLCTDVTLATGICLSQMRSREQTPAKVLRIKPDIRLLAVFSFDFYSISTLFVKNEYKNFFVPTPAVFSAGMLNNRTLMVGPSPLISQIQDVPKDIYCSRKCTDAESPCECLHLIKIPLGSVVELCIFDGSLPTTILLSHPFHIHGHSGHVLKEGKLFPPFSASVGELNEQLKSGAFLHDYLPIKDTVTVPSSGYTIMRILFDNPGFWLFHCHFAYHFDAGMAQIFWVGELEDLPPIPKNFPRCGNYLPPIYDEEEKTSYQKH